MLECTSKQSVMISSELRQIQEREVHYQMSFNTQESAGLVSAVILSRTLISGTMSYLGRC